MAVTAVGTATNVFDLPVYAGEFGRKVQFKEITLTGTYVAGGFAYATSFDLTTIDAIEFPSGAFSDGTNFAVPRWDKANSKVELIGTLAYEEAAAGYDFSNFKGYMKAYGY